MNILIPTIYHQLAEKWWFKQHLKGNITPLFVRGYVMASDIEEKQTFEACGCSAEMGFIIKEGDDTANVSLFGNDFSQLEANMNKYIHLATNISNQVIYETKKIENKCGLQAKFQFTCSAEKLIFELKTRSLAH